MPDVHMPDGTVIYGVPEGTTQRQLLDKLGRNGYDVQALLRAPQNSEEGSLLDAARDIPLALGRGVVGGARSITDVFGAQNAASRGLRSAEEFLGRLQSASAKRDYEEIARIQEEAEDQGFGAQVAAAIKSLGVAPGMMLAQGVGSIAPTLAAAALTGGTGALAIGAAQGAGAVKGSVFDAVKEEFLAQGVSEEQAAAIADAAQSYSGGNLDAILTGGALGALAGRFGIEASIAKPLGNSVARNLVARGVVGFAKEGSTEALQGAQERLAQNVALQREGSDVPTMRGVVTSGAMEGILGGILGGGVDVTQELGARGVSQEREAKIRAAADFTLNTAQNPTDENVDTAISMFQEAGASEKDAQDTVTAIFERYKQGGFPTPRTDAEPVDGGVEPSVPPAGREAVPPGATAEPGDAGTGAVGEPVSTPSNAPDGAAPSDVALAPEAAPLTTPAPTVGPAARLAARRAAARQPTQSVIEPAPTVEVEPAPPVEAQPVEATAPPLEINEGVVKPAKLDNPVAPPVEAVAASSSLDLAPVYDAPNMKERKVAAARVAEAVILELGVTGVQPKVVQQITNQISQRVKNETIDPLDLTRKVLIDKGLMPAVSEAATKLQQAREARRATFLSGTSADNRPVTQLPAGVAGGVTGAPKATAELPAKIVARIAEKALAESPKFTNNRDRSSFQEGVNAALGESTPFYLSEAEDVDLNPSAYRRGMEFVRDQGGPDIVAEYSTTPKDIDYAARENLPATDRPLTAEDRRLTAWEDSLKRARNMQRVSDAQYSDLLGMIRDRASTGNIKKALKQAEAAVRSGATERPASGVMAYQRASAEPAPAPLTPEQTTYSEGHTKDFPGSRVAYQNGDYGLVQGFSQRTNKPVYIPFMREYRVNNDIDLLKNDPLSLGAERLTELREAKQRLEAEEAARYVTAPAVTHNADGNAFSESVPENIQGVVSEWKKLLGLSVKLYVTTEADARKSNVSFTGPYRVVGSESILGNERGLAQKISADEYVITYVPAQQKTYELETLAHELGHVHMWAAYNQASEDTKKAIRAEHKKWADTHKPTDQFSDFVKGLRARTTARRTRNNEGLTVSKTVGIDSYWRSFDEWYADQVSRWAVSDEKPVSVVEKFFARLGRALRNFYKSLRGQRYLPTETFRKYLIESSANLNITPTDTEGAVSAQKETAEEKAPKPASMPKATKRLRDKEKETSAAIRKMQQSRAAEYGDVNDVARRAIEYLNGGLGRAILGHDLEAMLKSNFARVPDSLFKRIINLLPTTGLIDWVRGAAGESVAKPMDELAGLAARLEGEKGRLRGVYAKTAAKLNAFTKQHGQRELSQAYSNRMNRIDPTPWVKGTTFDEVLASDPPVQEYKRLIADPKTPAENLPRLQEGLEKRTKELREAHTAWNELGALPGGHEIYKDIINFYRTTYLERREALDNVLRGLGLEKEATERLISSLKVQMEKSRKDAKGEEGVDDHVDIDDSFFPEVYVPFNRYGDFWLRVSAKNGDSRQFYTFDTSKERDAFRDMIAGKRGVTTKEMLEGTFKDTGIDWGNNMDALRPDFNKETGAMQEMLKILDEGLESGVIDKDTMRDQLYQVLLMTTPERSIRRQYLHSDNVTGFSTDLQRGFNDSALRNANELANLKYKQKIAQQIKAIKDVAEGTPLRGKLSDVAENLKKRFEDSLKTDGTSSIVDNVNRFAFIYYLSGAATAIANVTSIPIRVMPHLSSRYGYGAATAMLVKYAQIWNSVGVKKGDNFIPVTLETSKLVTRSPANRWAFEEFRNHSAFEGMQTAIMRNRRTARPGAEQQAQQISDLTYSVITSLFTTSETLMRQSTAMMTFELEYAKLRKQGLNETAAREGGLKAGLKVVDDTLGNYGEFERPPIMQGSWQRSLFLFKMYSVNTTRFFVTNARAILKGRTWGEKRAALNELSGVLLLGAMFHGLTGMPLYGFITFALDVLGMALGDDEERRERKAEDPLLAGSSDAWFRLKWLPEHFGNPSIPGLDGRMHTLANIIEYGPGSELTDVNIGSRTSFNGLWFREPQPAETAEEQMVNIIMANVPLGSMALSAARAVDSFNQGDVVKGLEALNPAFSRGAFTAYRLGTQGVETRQGRDVVARSELNDANLIAQVLGFQPTLVADAQRESSEVNRRLSSLELEKSKLMGRLNEALTDAEGKPDAVVRAVEAIRKFNDRYPQPAFRIDQEDAENSFKTFQRNSALTYRGITYTKNQAPYVAEALGGGQ